MAITPASAGGMFMPNVPAKRKRAVRRKAVGKAIGKATAPGQLKKQIGDLKIAKQVADKTKAIEKGKAIDDFRKQADKLRKAGSTAKSPLAKFDPNMKRPTVGNTTAIGTSRPPTPPRDTSMGGGESVRPIQTQDMGMKKPTTGLSATPKPTVTKTTTIKPVGVGQTAGTSKKPITGKIQPPARTDQMVVNRTALKKRK